MSVPNANMVTSSYDRISGGVLDCRYQPLNNFRITNSGGNIIQGQMNKISVTEVMFPYNIPTITKNNRILNLTVWDITTDPEEDPQPLLTDAVVLPLGYKTGPELVADLSNALLVNLGIPLADYARFTWDPITQTIDVSTYAWDEFAGGYAIEFLNINAAYPFGAPQNQQVFSFPNALYTIGLRTFFAQNTNLPLTRPAWLITPGFPVIISANIPSTIAPWPTPAYTLVEGSTYTGRYTDYIDIVSTSLAQAQYIRDSNTNQAIPKRDVIARIYVCTNVSTYTADPAGSRPFTIWRNWTCPKVLKWTADRSIDAIDLALYDMYGEPLPIQTPATPGGTYFSGPSDYAITFHVHEGSAEQQNENVGYKY